MQTVKTDPIIQLSDINSKISKLPLSQTRRQSMQDQIARASKSLRSKQPMKAAENIGQLEQVLRKAGSSFGKSRVLRVLLDKFQTLRSTFRIKFGICIQPFKPGSQELQRLNQSRIPRAAPAAFSYKKNENPTVQKNKPSSPAPLQQPGNSPPFPRLGAGLEQHTCEENVKYRDIIPHKNRLPEYPSGVHVTIRMADSSSFWGEWFCVTDYFLKIKLSEDSGLYRKGQIVYLNIDFITSIS